MAFDPLTDCWICGEMAAFNDLGHECPPWRRTELEGIPQHPTQPEDTDERR